MMRVRVSLFAIGSAFVAGACANSGTPSIDSLVFPKEEPIYSASRDAMNLPPLPEYAISPAPSVLFPAPLDLLLLP